MQLIVSFVIIAYDDSSKILVKKSEKSCEKRY